MNNFIRTWGYFKQYKLMIFAAAVSSAIVSGTDAAIAYIVKDILDGIFISKDMNMLRMIPVAVAVLFAVRCVGRFTQQYTIQYTGQKAIENLRNDMFHKMIYLPMSYFDQNNLGEMMTKVINDVSNLQNAIASAMRIFRSLLSVVFLTWVVFFQNPKLGLFIFVLAPLLYLIVHKSGKKIKKNSHKIQEHTGLIGNALNESFTGVRVVKSFGTEMLEYKKFKAISMRELKYKLKQAMIMSISSPLIETLSGMGIAVIIIFGGSMVIHGETTTGTFFSFLTAFGMMFEPIKKLNNYNHIVQIARASMERIYAVIDTNNPILENNGSTPCQARNADITFENVSFAYEDTNVLNKINLNIPAGKTVAFVGSSGAGKTTIVSLLPRFYDITEGSIKIGDTDIRDFEIHSLRRNISIVTQSPFLFNTSIRENISYGLKDATDEMILDAAKQAYALDFINEQPDGLDSILGERGCKLSGGQRQRITIARAILMNPNILILDEATSALDTESEKVVQQALSNLMKNRTSLVVAHRLSTVIDADMIVVMDKGEILATGTHKELIEKCSYYANLCDLQFTS